MLGSEMVESSTVIGHQVTLNRLSVAISKGQNSHAYLITGPESVGKNSVARYLASALNCENVSEIPCGQCAQCNRISRSVHADCETISVDLDGYLHGDGNKRTVITIEQIRRIIRECYLKPYEGKYRVYIIQQCDRMSEEASNALLKTLEEPPEQVVLILLSSFPEKILPTLVSRAQVISLKKVNWLELGKGLMQKFNLDKKIAEELSKTCDGKPGIAVKMLEDEEYRQWRSDALDEVEVLAESGPYQRFLYGGSFSKRYIKNREDSIAVLTLWQEWWRDVLISSYGVNESIINQSRIDKISYYANQYGSTNSAKNVRILTKAIAKLHKNFNPSLTIEQLMLGMPILAKK
jgi:DNA polymerase-3 subunit delta'